MTNDGFFRKNMKNEIAQGNLTVATKSNEKIEHSTLKELTGYQYKMNRLQYIVTVVMIMLGIFISFINRDGIGITIGSLVQGDTTVSNITVNLGALLILGGIVILINITKKSNTNFEEK